MQSLKVDDFMEWVSTWANEAHPPLFAYVAVDHGREWALIKGMLYLNLVEHKTWKIALQLALR